jgi:imidazole glycerol-phosphate synthase subunit HisH
MNNTVAIIDYGMSNLRSIQHKLARLGIQALITSAEREIKQADKIILPGVGAFAAGMGNLKKMGILPILNEMVLEKKTPFLGICLGMQLLSKRSEEGNAAGLGWLDAETRKFNFKEGVNLPVPHVGWNTINVKKECLLLKQVTENQRFYFTHSYYVECLNPEDIVATTEYGFHFTSIIQRQNIFGTQFHPEKSHRRGMEIILDFIRDA